MPKKIHVVSLSPHDKVEEVQSDDNSSAAQVDEVSQIKEAIKEEEQRQEVVEESAPLEKPKPKRKPAAKKIKVEPVVVEQPVVLQPVVVEKKEELVKCPKCEKEMTKRTLRYNHKTCPGQKIDRHEIPVKRRETTKTTDVKKTEVANVPEDILEREVNKRIQDRLLQKIKIKEEKIKKLSSQIA